MVKIINSSNQTLAILQNIVSPLLSEGLNREFTFDFQSVIDGDKSQYLTYTNKIEVENNYFNMVVLKKSRTQEGLFFDISCEHVSYDLLSANFTAGFTATGLFSAVATTLLTGTGFTVGTVQVTGNETISVNESTNAFNVLKQLATLYNGELQFNKYQVNLLTRRGADRHVQFRYRKNLSNATVNIDARQKTAGVPKTSYEVGIAELEFEQGFISDGVSSLEHFELGDTVTVIDDDLGINTQLRIVKHSFDPEQRMQGTVEISNFVDDLADTITNIQTTSVAKDNIYNGCSIGPDNGFVAERSDGISRTEMNATDGIRIKLRDSATASYTSIFYVQIDTATGTAKLFLAGNAEFTGTVRGSQIIGGSILIGATAFATAPFSVTTSGAATADNLLLTGGVIQVGTTNSTFRFTETDGLWLGNTVFASAPFRVTISGSTTANDLTLTGGRFNVGTGTNTLQFNTTDGLFLGNTAAASAPFRVAMSGALTVSSATITGGVIQTSETGQRIVLTGNSLKTYNASSALNGPAWGSAGSTFGDLAFYDDGTETFRIENALTGGGWTLKGMNGGTPTYLNPTLSGDIQVGSATRMRWIAYTTATISATSPAGSTGDLIWGTSPTGTGLHQYKAGGWYILNSTAV